MTLSQGAEDFAEGFRMGVLVITPERVPSNMSLILAGFLLGIFAHASWIAVMTV